jgi:hypothetical protein
MINEKSVSASQQRLMGQAYGVRQFMDTEGKEGLDPKKVDGRYRKIIVKLAKEMTKKDLEDFAKTKHKGLPEVKESAETPQGNTDTVPTIYPYLKSEANQPKKKDKVAKMQNIADYREFINKKNNK